MNGRIKYVIMGGNFSCILQYIESDNLIICFYTQAGDRALGFCAADTCCQNKTDEAGRISCMFGRFSRNEYREEHPRCGTNGTCSPGVCNCAANRITLFDCFVPYNGICNEVPDANGKRWNFEGCIRDYPGYPDYQLYIRMTTCGISKCIANGGTYGSCLCQLFHSFCKAFGDTRAYSVSGNYWSRAICFDSLFSGSPQ